MKIIFTNRPKHLGSRLISLCSRKRGQKLLEVPSHVTLAFYDNLLIEAVIGDGVRLNYFPTFAKYSNIIAVYEYKSRERDHTFYKKAADIYHGQGYDYKGLIWFGWSLLMFKLFKKEIPKTNTFESKRRAFCNEILSIIIGSNTSHISPNEMMLELDGDDKFCKVEHAKK